ncbi:MAG: peptidylprolyl isomerase [Bacteroidetes bacterium]|nr:peptidylprolyl isomerase [Bacteroidota bacterium]MCW5896021.1 peptidylprolyl isomerase [Bacteroidota bacterium]
MRKSVTAFLFAGLIFSGCGKKEDIVAEADGHKITAREFKERYEQLLSQGSNRDNIRLRNEILTNMINERLIFNDVSRQGFDRDEAYKKRMTVIETQALLDRYARAISFDTLTISEQEGEEEFRRFNTTAAVRYLYAKTRNEALRLKSRLENGETFDKLAREVFDDPGLANNGGYLGVFGWGEMEPAMEETAFSLPVGSLSDPVKLNVGYAIIKVESRVVNPLASEFDYAKVKQKLADRIQEKKIAHLVKAAAEEASVSLSARFHEAAVRQVFEHWDMLSDDADARPETGASLTPDVSAMKLMEFSSGSWSIGDFVQKVEWTTEKQRRRVRDAGDVKDMAIGLATRDVLVKKARMMGLEKDSIYRHQVAHLRERYLLQRWANSVQDTVGQSGWSSHVLDSMYAENKAQYTIPPEVNVAEILVRTEDEANKFKSRALRGENFSSLARSHSIRLWAAKNGGELGYGTKASFGPMGDAFFDARVGDIIGPAKVDPYWGVFKIIGRRPGRQKTFEEAQSQIAGELLPFRKREVAAKAVGDLRVRSSITIHNDVLENVSIVVSNQDKR